MTNHIKLYTSTGTRKFIEQCKKYNVGLMMVPPTWRNPSDWEYFAVDNGCYSAYSRGVDWDSEPFLKMLKRVTERGLKPDFIVIPDKVADRDATLDMARLWIGLLKSSFACEYPRYLVVQDGMTMEDVRPFVRDIDGIFVGGTMDWKLSTMSMWCKFAHEHGLGCHVGRIGPVKRMFLAELAGADSIDSTTWVQTRNGVQKYVGNYKAQTGLEAFL